jgi:hypothetical protein
MDMNSEVDPDFGDDADLRKEVLASARGAGPIGFSGTVTRQEQPATGLNRMTGNGFGGSVTEPMLPGSWDTEGGASR